MNNNWYTMLTGGYLSCINESSFEENLNVWGISQSRVRTFSLFSLDFVFWVLLSINKWTEMKKVTHTLH